uniref:OCIA domain-containing protein n=1 Tax=Clastoptera arizonana TaxID=38151 RepID=A0A1B6E3I4_9HEMI
MEDKGFPGSGNPIPPTPYKFSAEELRVLSQCNSESFYKRSLPFSTILGAGIYFGVKAGYLKPSARFGAVPKVVTAVIAGFFLGKLSYQSICVERLMQLPNSELGAMLRKRKNKGGFQDTFGMDIPSTYGSSVIIPDRKDIYSDVPATFTDLDTDRPYDKGLDDTFRPNVDSTTPERPDDFVMPNSSQTVTSYEELRRKNREEYEQRKTKPYRGVVTPEDVPKSLPPRYRDESNQAQQSWKPKNIYGDEFEK